MKKNLKLFLHSTILLFACSAIQAQVINILNEDWSSGERHVQDLPNSARWYSSTPGDLSVQEGSIRQATLSSSGFVIAYFTNSEPVNLAQGQTLQVNYSYSLEGTEAVTGNLFRMGLFNSGTGVGRIDGDTFTSSEGEFVGYQGYLVDTNNISGGSVRLYKRVSTTNSNLMSSLGSSIYSAVGGSSASWSGLKDNVIYNGSLEITRNHDDTVTLRSILSDANGPIYNVVRTDSSDAYYSFDTFGMMLNAASGEAFTLNSVEISVIPEASTYAWMSLSFAVGLLAMLKRHKTSTTSC
jgi:hypothetical protein